MRIKNFLSKYIKITELLFINLFIAFTLLKCLYFQFTTKLNKAPYFSLENIFMIISTIAVIAIIVSLVFFVFDRKRLVALFIINLLLTILLIADTNFFRYYYNLITIPVFFQLNPRMINSVDQSIVSLFQFKDLIYIVDFPIMLFAFLKLNKRGVESIRFSKRFSKSISILAISSIIIVCISSSSNLTSFAYSNNYSAKSLGVLFSHFYNTKLFIKENILQDNILKEEEKKSVEEYLKSKNKENSSDFNRYKGIAEGKNLIIVQMEAMQQFVIGKTINGKEITPNLNRLIKESLYFDNIYYQVSGGNTSDAEFLANNSLYPLSEGSVYHRYSENTYHSLAFILKDKGYTTYALHAFDKTFWNREEMYKTLKFDTFFNSEDYIMDDFAGWSGNALSDKSFFRQSLNMIDTSKPFYSFFITLSNHHPFNYFENFDFDVGEFEGEYIGNFIKGANYADSCIGEFIKDLKLRGLYDNSLLVFYGDHSAIPKIESEGLMKFLGIEYNDCDWVKLQRVPLIIHLPGQQKGEVLSTTGGQIDIMPTIANLMGFDVPFALGKDLINTQQNYVVLRNGSIITDKYIYFNDTRELYDYQTGQPIDINLYENEIQDLIKELNISDIIISNNLLSDQNFKKYFLSR
ncbi:MAG TPA: LTA synthase family protein [Acetivibrio clariflavus]|nr:LTA synthase family protein [Acetivibrio clariflavus]